MTLEEAQNKILELTEENQNLKQEKETLSKDNETLKNDNESLRTLNQKYFNKLIAQETDPEPDGGQDEPETESCEEFAKKLEI